MRFREHRSDNAYARRCATDAALHHLQIARDYLVRAGSPRTLARVRAALKSAEGARRNADSRFRRVERSAQSTSEDAAMRSHSNRYTFTIPETT